MSISVDFPEPEGPTIPITLLTGIEILSPLYESELVPVCLDK